ncbi:hypothetical protein NHX12_006595 [Muraenolepis orangiensis]|uniref:Uncharacterized protein n=1 Tax=Muraenolepis orangiensis TaxID=630683 RepID=A0A9Q0ID14_9TELE|nr:hypothetical protein NHX12_006595 [Muraenolepis orangiensis]
MESPQDPASDPGTSSSEPATPGMDKPGSRLLEPPNKREDPAGAAKRHHCSPPRKGQDMAQPGLLGLLGMQAAQH